jgi:hypothetical protein
MQARMNVFVDQDYLDCKELVQCQQLMPFCDLRKTIKNFEKENISSRRVMSVHE